MKRIQEKVKDLIEVRSYKSLQDFIAEPSQTLAIYHFTDFTSDLMGKYLDKLAAVVGRNGTATALAGYRGVGKSHLLASFGALVAHPELRSKITDAHVSASVERLKRVRYPVAFVRRGSFETLLVEIKEAIARCFDASAANLPDALPELLTFAAERAGELPLVLIVDTAAERVSRVARDDGILLGEIAEAAKRLNIFVLAALDDDIADADGINAAISRNFTIDYLDQEHLYRIVDTHLFPKNRLMLPTLREIYANFREFLPAFRWSEQRFTALYPLHPIILEIAPFVRLYAPEFALLGFAADAAAKIMARPANSLIALDEVFDTVENSLRKAEDLNEAFVAYDHINKNYIAQISIMQRLQAKLVLKALFLLSLEGEGGSAEEIAAAMLIYDENEPRKSVQTVESLLEDFAAAAQSSVEKKIEPGKAARYSFVARKRDNLGSAVDEAIKLISPHVVPKILRRVARERFAEWVLPDAETQNIDSIDCSLVWRGGLRRGRVVWQWNNKPADAAERPSPGINQFDWELIIGQPFEKLVDDVDSSETAKLFWQPAPLRKDETETILRYYVVLSDKKLREEYGERLRTAARSYVFSVEKIWNRIFLEDAVVSDGQNEYRPPPSARHQTALDRVAASLLEPFFESRYPDHPYFTQTLGEHEVSALISDFFGGSRRNLAETQRLAETFALPLGLVALDENSYVVETDEHLANLSLTAQILALVKQTPDETVSLKKIYRTLKKKPYGLVGEAQHLILTALVAQRQIEFVTTSGDRINRRSLDLKIIWDDIEGVARPSSVVYSDERLTEWARILTGSPQINSISVGAERQTVLKSLEDWLTEWKRSGALKRFEKLPGDILNTKIWRLAVHVDKTFGVVAATVAGVADESISLEEGLHRVADAFNDSEKDFFAGTRDLLVLEDFIEGVGVREKIKNYLVVCENTGDEKIEHRRGELLELIARSYLNPNEIANVELEKAWENFREAFAEHFARRHDAVMKSPNLQNEFDEILKSDEWWEFENLSRLGIFEKRFRNDVENIRRRAAELGCRFEVGKMLEVHPFCACSFNLSEAGEWEKLPASLAAAVDRGRSNYLKTLRRNSQKLIFLIRQFAENNGENNFAETAANLTDFLKNEDETKILTNDELVVLQKVAGILTVAESGAGEAAI